MKKKCTSCGYVGTPINQCKESFLLDAFIWLVVGNLAMITGLLPLLVIPAGWTVYHIVNFKTKCPECGDISMVSMKKGESAAQGDHAKVWNDNGEVVGTK